MNIFLNTLVFFSFFYLLLISIIGYGLFFQNIFLKSINKNGIHLFEFTGFYGLFFITIISLLSSLFLPHNFIHNIILHLIGFLLFFLLNYEKKFLYIKLIVLISFFLISALLISKTHDDFSYYHLPFTKYLTENKVIFGMAYLSHGYKLISSLFFLNSTYYLPFIEYYSFHFTYLFFLIFFNFYLLKEIFFNKNYEIINFLYLLALVFFNLSFNRIAEYGTDKPGQLLIVILIIRYFQLICVERAKYNSNDVLLLIPLIAYCITLKTYFLPYALLGISLLFTTKQLSENLKNIIYSKPFVIFMVTLGVYFIHHFISTGCIISPLSFTCFGDNLSWAFEKAHFERLSNCMADFP